MPDWGRHALLRVDAEAWRRVAPPDLADWAARFPVMVRRPAPGEPADHIPVAIALPGRRRFAASVPRMAVIDALPPVALADALHTAPTEWQDVLQRLVARTAPDVFGGLLWQHLTGLPYLTAQSDVDLLWRDPGVIAEIAAIAATSPVRIDGEILFSCGAGVNWREWHGDAESVLAKHMQGVSLLPRMALAA